MKRARKSTWLQLNLGWILQLMKLTIRAPHDVSALKDIVLRDLWGMWGARDQNALTAKPRSYWSQSDEDGIIQEIVRRIDLPDNPTFIEFGVDDGTECNSVALLAHGWRGCWIGGQKLAVKTKGSPLLLYLREWVTLENIDQLMGQALNFIGEPGPNLCSMDLDGNDFHFVARLLEINFRPDVWVCEYNGTFPVGSQWVMPYSPVHSWERGTDYFGASFTSFIKLMKPYGYTAVATSVTGSNLFLIRDDHMSRFQDLNVAEEEIFRPSLPFLVSRKPFRRSAKTIESIISGTRSVQPHLEHRVGSPDAE